MSAHQKSHPNGRPKRGKTVRNRLLRIDVFLTLMERDLICREEGEFREVWVVDLGYGATSFTTLESAERCGRSPGYSGHEGRTRLRMGRACPILHR